MSRFLTIFLLTLPLMAVERECEEQLLLPKSPTLKDEPYAQVESYFEDPLFSLKKEEIPILPLPSEKKFEYFRLGNNTSQWEKTCAYQEQNPFRRQKKAPVPVKSKKRKKKASSK
jgi:hypothetical protein